MKEVNDILMTKSSDFSIKGKSIDLAEVMFCLSILAVFVPYKIYPLLFIASSVIFFLRTKKIVYPRWAIYLSIFGLYATISFLITYQGQPLMLTSILKLLINFIFLYFVVNWLAKRDNERLLPMVDYILHFIFVVVLVQLIVYHHAFDYKLIYGSSSSGQASLLYAKDLFFWGLDNKNMMGARIAMLGFPYILIPLIRKEKIALWRVAFIFVLAYLSLSRTPIVALIIGCGLLLWLSTNKRGKIIMLLVLLAATPFILKTVIRVNQLTNSNDGMGTRLVYWKAFFTHFSSIPIWGKGFLADPKFLAEYADFYRGEHHIHNVLMTNYLQMGIVGLVSYCLFLVYFIRDCFRKISNISFWLVAFLPLISIMLILYSGYDNDIIVYLTLIYLLGTYRQVSFENIKIRII